MFDPGMFDLGLYRPETTLAKALFDYLSTGAEWGTHVHFMTKLPDKATVPALTIVLASNLDIVTSHDTAHSGSMGDWTGSDTFDVTAWAQDIFAAERMAMTLIAKLHALRGYMAGLEVGSCFVSYQRDQHDAKRNIWGRVMSFRIMYTMRAEVEGSGS